MAKKHKRSIPKPHSRPAVSVPTGPILSIGMIVKNEMRSLERCLLALEPLRAAIPCELVIADTGSTDGTRELAARFADLLFDFTWCNDFAAARNAVLDRCRGLWHLQVDADEYLQDGGAELVNFLRSPAAARCNFAYVVQRNHVTFAMDTENYNDVHVRRLLRMASRGRYVGSIHEFPDAPGPYAMLSSIILDHDGYAGQTEEERNRKKRRNLPLLEKELERAPGNLRRIIQCLESSHTPAQFRHYAQMCVDTAERLAPAAFDADGRPLRGTESFLVSAAFAGAVRVAAARQFPEFSTWADTAARLCPRAMSVRLDLSFLCAMIAVGKKDGAQALDMLARYRQALEAHAKNDYDMQENLVSLFYFASAHASAQAAMLECAAYILLGRLAEACTALEGVVQAAVHDPDLLPDFLRNLFALYRQGAEESAEGLLCRLFAALDAEGCKKAEEICSAALWGGVEDSTEADTEDNPWTRPLAPLFASLGAGRPLGRAAQMLCAPSAEAFQALLDADPDSAHLSAAVVGRAMELGCALPEAFFAQSYEDLATCAEALACLWRDCPGRLLDATLLPPREEESIHIRDARALWAFLLAAALLRQAGWEDTRHDALFSHFLAAAQSYGARFYDATLLRGENRAALPVALCFALRCAEALAPGTEARAALLRAAAADAPEYEAWLPVLLGAAG